MSLESGSTGGRLSLLKLAAIVGIAGPVVGVCIIAVFGTREMAIRYDTHICSARVGRGP